MLGLWGGVIIIYVISNNYFKHFFFFFNPTCLEETPHPPVQSQQLVDKKMVKTPPSDIKQQLETHRHPNHNTN